MDLSRMRSSARYSAVFLVMMSNLMLELLLTRIFSATMWYHFAFMAVSIALFGTTVGAVAVQLAPRHFRPERSWRLAARYALLYALAIVFCTAGQLRINAVFSAAWIELIKLAGLYLLITPPFVLSGVFICQVLIRAGDRLGAMYCADLLGAGAGCALFVSFMTYGDGPRAVLLLAGAAALGAALMALSANDRFTQGAAAVVAALCVATFIWRLDGDVLQVRWAKGRPDAPHAFEQWNAFSRITVDPWTTKPFGWGFGSGVSKPASGPEQKFLQIDNAAATVLTAFDGDVRKVDYLESDVTALAYSIRRRGRVLVIGVGGARDILTALAFEHRVVGVEVNDSIIGLLRGPFAAFTGNLGSRPDVELVHDEARSFATHSQQRFDVIQASMVDTWAAAASGAYVLSENALYTREALGIFLDRLARDGILSLSRWYYGAQPGETLRLVTLAADVLRRRGSKEPQRHLFLAHNDRPGSSVATLLISVRPFNAAEIVALRSWCQRKYFVELLSPDLSRDSILDQLAGPLAPDHLLASYPIDLSAPTDNRPFFFNMLRFRDAFRGHRHGRSDLIAVNADAVVTLSWFFVLVVTLSVVFIVGPLWLGRSRGERAFRASWRFTYFVGVGLGFILIELSQMQRLMIALGHPVYGLTVVLFSLLIAAGLGSLWTQRVINRGAGGVFLRRALGCLLLVGLLTAIADRFLAHPFEFASAWTRIAGSVLILVPLGFVLGVPMAAGLALSASDPPGYRALYWGANGAASVCGSVLATMLSLSMGITATYFAGIAAYSVAAVAAVLAFARQNAPPTVRRQAEALPGAQITCPDARR
jgi:hypothetical protein